MDKNELVEEYHEQKPQEEINKKASFNESLNQKENQLNEKSQSLPVRKSKSNQKKNKIRFPPRKSKRISMYLVLIIFLSFSLLSLLIDHYFFEENIKELFENNKIFSLIIFSIFIVGSLILSAFASYFECFLETHFFGIIFFIILNFAIDYCIIYINNYSYFEQLFCTLVVLVSGSIGLIIITLVIKDEDQNSCVLYIFNALFSVIAGCIMCSIYNTIWNLVFSIVAFIISEFNVYSSQYKFGKNKIRKEPMIYSQPFELIISIFKLFYMIIYLFIKTLKFIFKSCKKRKTKEDNNKNVNQQYEKNNNENSGSSDEGVGQEHVGGEVEIHEQAQE